MTLKFETAIEKSSIFIVGLNNFFGTNEIDYGVDISKALVKYDVLLDIRSWGVSWIEIERVHIELFCDISVSCEFLSDDEIKFLKSKGFVNYLEELVFFNWHFIKDGTHDLAINSSIFGNRDVMISELYVEFLENKNEQGFATIIKLG